MAFNSNGQISYLVLDSLSSGSKYGLEIIEYISKKTGGTYLMKKPTLYSCLTRMEKKGLVSSSYWGESELGGKRHYYSITAAGRGSLEELSRLFANATFVNDDAAKETPTPTAQPEEKSTFLHQGNIFDMVKEEKVEKKTEPETKSDIIENQIDIFNMDPIAEPEKRDDGVFLSETETIDSRLDEEKMTYYQNKLEQSPQPEFVDGGKFLDETERLTPDQEEQNKRIYDTSSELKKYRKKKSFSENQIEMAVVYEDEDYEQIQKERIAELKRSLLNIKQNGADQKEEPVQSFSKPEFEKSQQMLEDRDDGVLLYQTEYVEARPLSRPETKIETEEVESNDAIFITEPRMTDIPVQKKITPPNIEINLYDSNLPAPKRNSELEPTYKDMMAKLFERKKEKEIKKPSTPSNHAAITGAEPINTSNFTDYSTLKRYYNSQGITFKEYKKTNVERNHNTNLLNLISSAILLLLSGIGSAIIFGIISGTHNLNSGTNFMFYTLPILFLVLVVVDFVLYKFTKSKKATLFYNSFINWIIFILSVAVIFGINALCKMQFETIGQYATSLFIPILGILLLLPANYHIRKFLYSRYGK